MTTADETSRLLRAPPMAQPSPKRPGSRPPLYAIPSSQSLSSSRSLSNLHEPILDTYFKHSGSKTDFDSTLSAYGHSRKMDIYAYIAYYCPILSWLPNYDYKNKLLGDFLAGISLASFQIPLVMSITQSLAHLPPIMGLYSIIVGAFVYSIFGSVPVLIVGPSPSTALIFGLTIELIRHYEEDKFTQLDVSAALSLCLGGILLGAGIFRFGFLDNVLSRALLKGFIGAMGLIMIINELSVEMGLTELALKDPHITTLDKVAFVFKHYDQTHIKTLVISVVTLTIVMAVRTFKNKMVNQYKRRSFIYIPELLMMVIVGTFLCYVFRWDEDGVEIVGDVTSTSSVDSTSIVVNPFSVSKLSLYKKVFFTAFLCTVLGYFDSTTASKALGVKFNYNISSNRELVALGMTNFVVGLIGGLPCFGALGRSKINVLSGATSAMALLIMGTTVLIAIFSLLQLLYFLPECILALSTTIVGITVLEEVPQDLQFFWNIGGYDEIFNFVLIFLATIFWSGEAGVVLGISIAVVRVIKHSTKSRIQILGRVPHTNSFRNADELIEESFLGHGGGHNYTSEDQMLDLIAEIEDIEGVLIIKIPEPLNFANVGDLKNRLNRIEKYGTLRAHPSQPSGRNFDSVKHVIFDCKGMESLDSSAVQTLYEIVSRYCLEEKVSVSFSRLTFNSSIRDLFKALGITQLVNKNFSEFNSVSDPLPYTAGTTSHAVVGLSSSMGNGFFLSIDEALRAIDRHELP